ncbi:MAG TPA: hemolysin III family protein [Ktedonobacteraceae bacterium]|nr:hemolysin III family protein [Ktedonobacteraceae bacterium]
MMRETLSNDQIDTAVDNKEVEKIAKPLLRGWFHAVAAVGAVVLTIVLCWLSRGDTPRLISMLIFGLSMVELYTVSATYHIGKWPERTRRVLRSLDHANIFVLIAGTYTPLCFNILEGWLRITILSIIWFLALLGMAFSVLTLRLPRWVGASLYIGMGWISLLAIPGFLAVLPWIAVATLMLGGLLYTIGAVVYARRWPNPFPRILGFHEIFHLFVIAGSIAFAACIWIWALPFPRR